ncbi:MAG: DUF6660 family protein [Saprospiraceae bacterium]
MNFVAILLSIIIFSVSSVPCSDGMEFLAYNDSNTITHISNECSGHSHSSEDTEYCSPFCTCQCCGITLTIPSGVLLNHTYWLYSEASIVQYEFSYSFDYSKGIWHPPTA